MCVCARTHVCVCACVCVCVWIIIADNTFERESEIILKMVLLLVKLKGIIIFIHQEMVTRNVNYVSHLSILH